MTDTALAIVQRSWVMHTRVESWLGDQLLAEDVPVITATEEGDRTLRIPERVTLTVPREDQGVSWDAQSTTHPLAPYGQQLRCSVGVDLGNGVIEWLQRGWFLITDSVTEGDSVRVEASGLLKLIDEARFTSPYQPSGTFVSTLRSLVEPAVTVDASAAPVDRAAPASMQWDEDRLGAVLELLDAWPADARVDETGVLVVSNASDPASSVMTLTDGAGGTVVQWAGSASREDGFSLVVARGQAADGGQVQGVAQDLSSGPLRLGGPFNPLPVPFFFFSPLLTTVSQCQKAAQTILARKRRSAAERVIATCVPHPGLVLGDRVTMTGAGLVNAPCIIERINLPYVADSGPMALELRVV